MLQSALPSESNINFMPRPRCQGRHRADAASAHWQERMPVNAPDLFDLLAETVLGLTGAIGAAMALTIGGKLRCCGSAGNAPPKGTVVTTESTLVRECMRTGQIMSYHDGGRNGVSAASALLLPIRQCGAIFGVLGLFWRDPHAISNMNVDIARVATDMIAATLELCAGAPTSLSPNTAAEQADCPDPLQDAPEPAVHGQPPAIAKPLPTKRRYGLPCQNCGAYYFSDEPSCPICTAST